MEHKDRLTLISRRRITLLLKIKDDHYRHLLDQRQLNSLDVLVYPVALLIYYLALEITTMLELRRLGHPLRLLDSLIVYYKCL